jgi:hypothetical protein
MCTYLDFVFSVNEIFKDFLSKVSKYLGKPVRKTREENRENPCSSNSVRFLLCVKNTFYDLMIALLINKKEEWQISHMQNS